MRKISTMLLSAALLAFAPTLSMAAPPPPKSAPPQVLKGSRAEQHPHIRQAIQELREARRELETAAHDFGGHRKEAMEAVDNAIKQLQQALQYDRK